jgi:hypothetical protein
MKELIEIQNRLNAPKSRRNDFGKYNYRSAEDILKAAKPLLKELGCVLLLSDEVKEVGNAYTFNTQENDSRSGKSSASAYNGTRVYVVATATIIKSAVEKLSVQGMAREEVAKKGMDAAQITGAASSCARKYALNGLFAIDDGTDADSLNTSPQYTQQQGQAPFPPAQPQPQSEQYDPKEIFEGYAKPEIEQARTKEDLVRIYNGYQILHTYEDFLTALTARRKKLGIKNKKE